MLQPHEIGISQAVALLPEVREYVRGASVIRSARYALGVIYSRRDQKEVRAGSSDGMQEVRLPMGDEDRQGRVLSEVRDGPFNPFTVRLDHVNTIQHVGRSCPTKAKAAEFFGIAPHWFGRKLKRGELAVYLRQHAKDVARRRRRSDTRWRCVQAMKDRPEAAVIFATLTFPPEYESLGAGKGWAQYRRRFLQHCPDAEYVCVLERAGQLHLHVLWITDSVPDAWMTDPARFLGDTRRELSVPRSMWPFGFSSHKSVRFGPQDYFGRRGHLWPGVRDPQTNKVAPMEFGSREKVAGYIAKYLTKDHGDPKWRMRMSRKFGLQNLSRQLLLFPQDAENVQRSPDLVTRNLPPSQRPSGEIVRRASLPSVNANMTSRQRDSLVASVVTRTCHGSSYSQRPRKMSTRYILARPGHATGRAAVSEAIDYITQWSQWLLYRHRPSWLGELQ